MNPDAAPSTPSPAPGGQPSRPPAAIPDHEVLRKIGGGSYGEVWLARNIMGSYRAVKVIHRNKFSEDRPYNREFEGIRNFEPVSRSHPSQVNVFQVGRNDAEGFFYYVMELADDQQSGQQIDPDRYEPRTLRSVLNQRGRLPVAECLEIGLALTTALKHLHGAGLIHRDIKPSNVIFVHGMPKLADIGLVAAADEACSFVGTEGYVAAEGPGKVQADVFALGKVLYQMLTGLRAECYPSLPEEWAMAPDRKAMELNQVVMRACEPDVGRRYQTATEMEQDLQLLKSGKSLLRLRKLEHAYRRVRLILFGGVALVALSVAIFVFVGAQNRAAEEARRSELKAIRISRMEGRFAPWFTNEWSRVERAAAIRNDEEVLDEATATLPGIDAKRVALIERVGATSAAFSADGSVLLGGLDISHAVLLDTNGVMTELAALGEGPVCWSPDGVPIQLAALTNGLVLRDARSGDVRRKFSAIGFDLGTLPARTILAVTTDGNRIAASSGKRVFIWESEAGALLGTIPVGPTALAFSPDGTLLGAGNEDGTARVYAVPTLTEVARLPPASRGSPITCLAFSRDPLVRYDATKNTEAWLMATGDKGAEIWIWDLQRRLPRTSCRGSDWTVAALAFQPDGQILASSGRGQVVLWDVSTGKPLLKISSLVQGKSRALAFDFEGRRLVSGGLPGDGRTRIALWEIETSRDIQVLRGLASKVRQLWVSQNGQRVAALSDDWRLATWELSSGRLLHLFDAPVGGLADSAGGCFDATGQQFAFASGHEARLYDLVTGDTLQRWNLVEGSSDQMQYDTRGRLLLLRTEVVPNQQQSWRLYELRGTNPPVLLHKQRDTNSWPLQVALAPGGERFLVWDWGPIGEARVIRGYSLADGREQWKATTQCFGWGLPVAMDPTGQRFAFGSEQHTNDHLMRFSDFKEIAAKIEWGYALSPSGKEFAGSEHLIIEREGRQFRLPLAMEGHGSGVGEKSSFSPDGRKLAWGTTEGPVYVVDIPAVCQRVSTLPGTKAAFRTRLQP